MKFCQHCGKELLDEAVVCPACGFSVQSNGDMQTTEVDESVNVVFVILAVLFPIFGIVYWPVKAKTRPTCAKACGIASIITFAVSFVITALKL